MFCQSDRTGNPARTFTSTAASLLLIAAALTLPGVSAGATIAGRTAGTFAVSPTGAATYTIPISAPPGPQGLQPHIALTYNSKQGNGYVGVGWSVSGLSSIYRCNLTYAQDTAPAPVALVTSDGYCIDGQRLRLTGGTYGAAGSTYQTEVANFENVTAYGTAGNGPAYWIAQDRNGRSYTYGNGGSSQVLANGTSTAIAWLLDEVSDPSGNTMTISYSTANTIASAVPSTISWTPSSHGSSSYNYTMTFGYGANVPQSSYYGSVAGTKVQNTNLLSSITVAYTGTTVKEYFLSYTTSPTTGRDELTSVKECADSAGSNCLLPTTITYQSGTAGVSTAKALTAGYTHYDFNGDGYPDLLYVSGSTYYVAFGSASGYGAGVNTGIPSTASQILPGNLTGHAGQDGILAAVSGTWYYYSWSGSSFTQTSTGLTYDSTAVQYLIADVNGDGLPDLIAAYFINDGPGNGYDYQVYVRVNTGGGTSVSFGSAVLAFEIGPDELELAAQPKLASNSDNAGGLATAFGNLRRFDFDGDGRDDLSLQTITKIPVDCPPGCTYYVNAYELISSGSNSSPAFNPALIYSAPASAAVPVAFLNFNSDACTDYLVGGTIYIAGCNGSTPGTVNIGQTIVGAMDWDGDGRTDVLVANGSTVGVYVSTGTGVGSLISTSIPYNSGYSYFTLPDPNGDGLDAFGYSTGTSAYYYPHNGAGTPPDLVSSITDGYGNYFDPTYHPMGTGPCYVRDGTPPPYPDAAYRNSTYLTCSYTASDGIGGSYSVAFAYYDSDTNLQGRGWQGFERVYSQDSRTGILHMTSYSTVFPNTGVVTYVLDRQSDGSTYIRLFSPTLASLSQETLSSTPYQQRYFPWFTQSQLQMYEFGGAKNGQLTTTSTTTYGTPDSYGNFPTVSVATQDNDTTSPYYGTTWTTTTTNTLDVDTTHWCLNLYTEVQVAYSDGTPADAVTRTKTFTPDTTNCRYTQIVTEPNSSQFKVTEALGYDSFGNINSDSLTGVAMGGSSPATRTTQISWTTSAVTTGQFPMTVTDPSGAQTQFNYNFSYGLKSSVTDPNNVTTSWAYTDGFGRKTQETRPDGTYTTWSYGFSGTEGLPYQGLFVTYNAYASNGTRITTGNTAYDSLDRVRIATPESFSGGNNRTDTTYDSLGRISQRSFPCTFTSWTTKCTYWTTNSYDVLNRLTQSQRPISSTNSNLQTTTYAYAGRTTTVTDPQSNARITVTDVNGWLRQTKDPMGYSVTLSYDSAGSKTKLTDSLGNTLWTGTYNYGLAAYLASATDMDMGSWGFTIDALGEKTAWSDAKSQSFSETYDALSRPLTRTDPDLFTQWTWGSSAASHNIGKLQSECTGTGTSCSSSGYSESETYDSLGRPSQKSITISGYSAFTYTWAYNATTGLLNTLTYPTSTAGYALELQYGYANGVLQTVTDISDTPNVTVWTANTMDPAGHVTAETLGNGIVTNRAYDAVTQWLGTAQSGVGGGAGVKNLAFLYDEMGNVTQRQDNNLGLTENIYYDSDYRFSYSKLNGTQNLSVTYDGTGNITSRSDVAGGASWTYDSNRKHEVTQAGSSAYQYSYDANGNAYSRQGSSITWSSYNYPTTVNAGSGSTAEAVAFSYGPDRQRWQQMYTGNGTQETTNYIGGLLQVVASGGVTDYRHYINAGGENVAVYSRKSNGSNTFSYLMSDHQASVASITNSSGAQVVGESFTVFGSRRNPSTWSGAPSNSDLVTIAGVTREGYTFQTALGLWMGMNHMNGRVEDSVTGRFLSADPHIPNNANPQSYNRFSYVNNNPLSYNDPSGFVPCGWLCKPKDGTNLMCQVNGIGCDEGTGGIGTPQYFYQQWVSDVSALSGEDGGAAYFASQSGLPATLGVDSSRGCPNGCSSGDSTAQFTVDLTPPPTCDSNDENCEVTVCAGCKATFDVPMPALPQALQNYVSPDQTDATTFTLAGTEAVAGRTTVGLGQNFSRIYTNGWMGNGSTLAFKVAPILRGLGGVAFGATVVFESWDLVEGPMTLGEWGADMAAGVTALALGGPPGLIVLGGYNTVKTIVNNPTTFAGITAACIEMGCGE